MWEQFRVEIGPLVYRIANSSWKNILDDIVLWDDYSFYTLLQYRFGRRTTEGQLLEFLKSLSNHLE